MHDRLKTCRKQGLAELASLAPVVVPILQRAYAAADDDTTLLLQRRMPWGERVRRGRDRALAMQAELLGLVQQANQQTAATAIAQTQAAAAAEARRQANIQQGLQTLQNTFGPQSYWVPQFPQQPAQRNLTCSVNRSPSLFGPTLNCN